MLLVLWDPQNRLDFATLQGSVYCMQRRGSGELSHKTHSDTAGLGLTPGNKTGFSPKSRGSWGGFPAGSICTHNQEARQLLVRLPGVSQAERWVRWVDRAQEAQPGSSWELGPSPLATKAHLTT